MTLETLDMIWRLVTGLYLPDFLPYGRPKGPKIENEGSKNIVLSSLWKVAGQHEQLSNGHKKCCQHDIQKCLFYFLIFKNIPRLFCSRQGVCGKERESWSEHNRICASRASMKFYGCHGIPSYYYSPLPFHYAQCMEKLFFALRNWMNFNDFFIPPWTRSTYIIVAKGKKTLFQRLSRLKKPIFYLWRW